MRIFDLNLMKWIDTYIGIEDKLFDKYFSDVYFVTDENDEQVALNKAVEPRYSGCQPIMLVNVDGWSVNDEINALNIMNNKEYYTGKNGLEIIIVYQTDGLFSFHKNGIDVLFSGRTRTFYECTDELMLGVVHAHIALAQLK